MSDNAGFNETTLRLAALLRHRAEQNGTLLPGEAELACELGIGRSALRESLAILEAFGAVETRKGARRRWVGLDLGALITAASQMVGSPLEETRELLEVRRSIETSMLARVMPLHSASSLNQLRDVAQAMVDQASRGESFVDLDQHFHLSLFRPLGNSVMEGVLSSFWALLRLVDHPDVDVARDVEVATMHIDIIDAMATGDYDLARHFLDSHFYGVRRRIVPSRIKQINAVRKRHG